MNRIFLLAFLILSTTAWGQQRSVELPNFEYTNNIKAYNNDYLVTGYTTQLPNRDGYAMHAFLLRYNAKLDMIWSLTLDSTSKSYINSISIFNNKIYALVTHGKNSSSFADNSLHLYAISLEGKVTAKTTIVEHMFFTPTNIVLEKNKLYFCYTHFETINYGGIHNFTPVLVEYDLKTKALLKVNGNSAPCFALHGDREIQVKHSRLFFPISYDKKNRIIVKDLPFQKGIRTKLIDTTQSSSGQDYTSNTFISGDEVVSLAIDDASDYDKRKLKITRFNMLNNQIKDTSIWLKDYQWKDLRWWRTYADKETMWLLVRNIKSDYGECSYVQIDKYGKRLAEIPLKGYDRGVGNFIITDTTQIQGGLTELTITNEPVKRVSDQ